MTRINDRRRVGGHYSDAGLRRRTGAVAMKVPSGSRRSAKGRRWVIELNRRDTVAPGEFRGRDLSAWLDAEA